MIIFKLKLHIFRLFVAKLFLFIDTFLHFQIQKKKKQFQKIKASVNHRFLNLCLQCSKIM